MDNNYQQQNGMERELGWDDTIQQEQEYITLPAGDYDFRVERFERGRYEGGKKVPPCNQANLTIVIVDPASGRDVKIQHNLLLHSKLETMLSEFFRGIGQKKKDEPLRMNWQMVPGATGRCKVVPEEYNGNMYNKIKKFYPKDEVQQSFNQAPQYNPGQF